MIIGNRLVQLGNIVQGRADVFVADLGYIGFVEQRSGRDSEFGFGWKAYNKEGACISSYFSIKREHAVRELSEQTLRPAAAKSPVPPPTQSPAPGVSI